MHADALEVESDCHLATVLAEVLMLLSVNQLTQVLVFRRDVLQKQIEGQRI